ncbi:Glycosyl hydrolases 36 [Sesbania bispinosa]|nr:Glycosyl hydrolases 36 [Sesbania bispinosa]
MPLSLHSETLMNAVYRTRSKIYIRSNMRVELTRQYHQALDVSIARNFPDNGCIAYMSHNTDALYCSKQTAVVRASDDFFPRNPVLHIIHIASMAYNSIFLGEFMQPVWTIIKWNY